MFECEYNEKKKSRQFTLSPLIIFCQRLWMCKRFSYEIYYSFFFILKFIVHLILWFAQLLCLCRSISRSDTVCKPKLIIKFKSGDLDCCVCVLVARLLVSVSHSRIYTKRKKKKIMRIKFIYLFLLFYFATKISSRNILFLSVKWSELYS